MDTLTAFLVGLDWKTGAAWMALPISLWGLWVGLVSSRKARFINTVTNQRIQWIELLRQDIAKFVGLAGLMIFDLAKTAKYPVATSADNQIELHRLHRVILLRLNPDGPADCEIADLLPKIQKAAFTHDAAQFGDQPLEKLTELAQRMLKTEWEKVKREAENGRISEYWWTKAWKWIAGRFKRGQGKIG